MQKPCRAFGNPKHHLCSRNSSRTRFAVLLEALLSGMHPLHTMGPLWRAGNHVAASVRSAAAEASYNCLACLSVDSPHTSTGQDGIACSFYAYDGTRSPRGRVAPAMSSDSDTELMPTLADAYRLALETQRNIEVFPYTFNIVNGKIQHFFLFGKAVRFWVGKYVSQVRKSQTGNACSTGRS